MSRRNIPNAPGSPDRRRTVVGWDAPLASFFAQAIDPPLSGDELDDEEIAFWFGADDYGEIPTLDALRTLLQGQGVVLPDDIADLLAGDQQREGARDKHPLLRAFDASNGQPIPVWRST